MKLSDLKEANELNKALKHEEFMLQAVEESEDGEFQSTAYIERTGQSIGMPPVSRESVMTAIIARRDGIVAELAALGVAV